jgi:hypothetical protein
MKPEGSSRFNVTATNILAYDWQAEVAEALTGFF